MQNFESREKEGSLDPSKKSGTAGGSGDPTPANISPESEGLGTDSSLHFPVDDDLRIQRIGVRLERIDKDDAAYFRSELAATPEHLRERLVFYLVEAFHVRSRNKDVLELIVKNIDLVPDVDKTVLAQRFFDLGSEGGSIVARYLPSFTGANPSLLVTRFLQDEISPRQWLAHIELLPDSERERIFLKFIAQWNVDTPDGHSYKYGPAIAEVMEFRRHIPLASNAKIVAAIVESLSGAEIKLDKIFGDGDGRCVLNIDHGARVEIARLREVCSLAITLVEHLTDFQGVDLEDTLLKLVIIDPEVAEAVAHNLGRFPRVDKLKLANRFWQHSTKMRGTPEDKAAVYDLIKFQGDTRAAELLASGFKFRNQVAPLHYYCSDFTEHDDYYDSLLTSYQPKYSFKSFDLADEWNGDSYFRPRTTPAPSLAKMGSFGDDFRGLLHWVLTQGKSQDLAKMRKAVEGAPPVLTRQVGLSIKDAFALAILEGRVTRGTEILKLFQLAPIDIAPEVCARVDGLLATQSKKMNSDLTQQLLAFGAWSLLEPEITATIPEGRLHNLLPRLQGVFGKPTSRELEHFRRYGVFDEFCTYGLQTLTNLGMLTEANWGAVGQVLPEIMRQAGTRKAWVNHRSNLKGALEEDGAARTALSPAQVEFELRTLLEFYHQFNGVRAPDLYREFRACKPRPGSNDDQEVYRAKLRDQQRIEWQAAFEESVLQQNGELHLDEIRLQYLDAWTRADGQVKSRFIFDSYPAMSIPLSPKTIMVAASKMDEGEEPPLPTQIQHGYKILRDLVISCSGQEIKTFHHEIAQSARDELIRQHGAIHAWLNGVSDAKVPPHVVEKSQAELSRLAALTKEIEAATDVEKLLRPMLQVRHKSFKPLIQKLLIADALERQHNSSDLLKSLDEVPQVGSVTALGEFVKNQLFDESFRALRLSPEEAKAAKNALPTFDLKAVMAGRIEQDTEHRQSSHREHREVVVYPTRGILAEVAGYFADACWTDHEDLMRRHPNAIALVFTFPMRHSFGGSDGLPSKELTTNKLVGACYLLQAKDRSGQDVIVLRGINPRERPFEKLSMQSFIEGLLDEVVVPYARELGAKKVVIPFDSEGHAQTNRLRLGAYLSDRYGQAPYVPLDHKGPSTNFNDRRIFDQCRLVRTIE